MLEMWHFKTAYVVDALASLLLSKKSDWMHSLVMNNWWLWRFAKGWSVFDAKHSKTVNISSVSNTFHGQIVGWSSIPRLWTAEECDTQGGTGENWGNVILREGLERIGDKVFPYCTSLEYMLILSTVKSLGHKVFSGCRFKEVDFCKGSLPEIGCGAFKDCSFLKRILIPSII